MAADQTRSSSPNHQGCQVAHKSSFLLIALKLWKDMPLQTFPFSSSHLLEHEEDTHAWQVSNLVKTLPLKSNALVYQKSGLSLRENSSRNTKQAELFLVCQVGSLFSLYVAEKETLTEVYQYNHHLLGTGLYIQNGLPASPGEITSLSWAL